ncbi:MAG: archaellin/type IV pilin N-terminal domain-containing protein, partial [Halohasta sp.]
MFKNENRGQVGIGTLIVFIAMVLVAAIAAGVLINTAGLLQSQAESTGDESSEQVSDRVQVVNTVGYANESGNITDLNVSVRRTAGADDIDLNKSTVEVFAGGNSSTLTYDEDNPTKDGDHFDITNTNLERNYTLSDADERAALDIYLKRAAWKIGPGDTVAVQ